MEKIKYKTEILLNTQGRFIVPIPDEHQGKFIAMQHRDVHVTLSPVEDPECSRRIQSQGSTEEMEAGEVYIRLADLDIYIQDCCEMSVEEDIPETINLEQLDNFLTKMDKYPCSGRSEPDYKAMWEGMHDFIGSKGKGWISLSGIKNQMRLIEAKHSRQAGVKKEER